MEAKCFDGDVAHVSTFEFHEYRERAAHLEQWIHKGRLELAASYAQRAQGTEYVDLGCGDGGLVSLLRSRGLEVYGLDFQPSNVIGWMERNVAAFCRQLDFIAHWDEVPIVDTYIITEVLEHLTDPHDTLARVRQRDAQLICSSPFDETWHSHDECHAWAWDMGGYAAMIGAAGFTIQVHETVDRFQVVWAVPA